MWIRKDLKTNAKVSLKANYWKVVLASLVLMAIGGAGSAAGGSSASHSDAVDTATAEVVQQPEMMMVLVIAVLSAVAIAMVISFVLALFITNPLQVGTQKLFLNCKSGQAECSDILSSFNGGAYLNVVKTMFFMDLFLILWSLLFVIPGIIKAYEYRMIPYILAEHPEMDRKEVFAKSKEMMTGNKWKTFVLDLSFIGWHILGICTCGLAEIFYVAPYCYLTSAELYQELNK